jgi:hypothetical protein
MNVTKKEFEDYLKQNLVSKVKAIYAITSEWFYDWSEEEIYSLDLSELIKKTNEADFMLKTLDDIDSLRRHKRLSKILVDGEYILPILQRVYTKE